MSVSSYLTSIIESSADVDCSANLRKNDHITWTDTGNRSDTDTSDETDNIIYPSSAVLIPARSSYTPQHTVTVQADPLHKSEIQNEMATESASALKTTQLNPTNANEHYISTLQQMFPAMDRAYLADRCRNCELDREFELIVMSLVDQQPTERHQHESTYVEKKETEHPFFDIVDEEPRRPNRYLMHLEEMFPNVSKLNLKRHCESFDDDVELDTLVMSLASLEVTESTIEKPLEQFVEEESSSDSSDDTFVSANDSLPRKHPLFMQMVEMFPDVPINDLERHMLDFDGSESIELMTESFLKLDLPTTCFRSERLNKLVDMFPHIDIAVLERHCKAVATDVPLDSLVEAIMAEEEAEDKSSVPIAYQNGNLQQLVNVFPHIAVEDLENVCKEHSADVSLNTLVFSVINSCGLLAAPLEYEGAAALPPEENLEQLNAYETLLNILPNADPDFLREKFESFAGDDGALKRFIANALENQNYPTYEEYTKRSKKVRVQRQYREKFSPKSFLELVPDAISHFSKKTYCATKAVMEQQKVYIRSRFKDINDETIDQTYQQEKYNLYNTCKRLESYEGPLVAIRDSNDYEVCYNDIVSKELLQEIALIENEKKICKYIGDQKAAKEKALEQARIKNELLTCNCCYDDSVLLEDMVACTDGHLFCKECVRSSTEVLIGDGKLVFPCLMDCGKTFTLHTLKVVLKPAVFFKMAQRQQLEEVQAANIDELETCPFCDFGAIPLPGDKVFTCLNTDCMQISCRYCKEPNHIPQRCDELPERDEQVKARVLIEDSMTQALVRECYKCKKKFVKTDGCNKMTCSCGALMCYLCRQPVKDYSHFNGQGGSDHHKCPLWSNNEDLHVKAVQAAAAQAREKVIAASKNPEFALKHDPTHVLP